MSLVSSPNPGSLRRRRPSPLSSSPSCRRPRSCWRLREETRQQKRERDPSPLNQTVMADDAASCQSGSTAAEPPLERQYSNKRVKRSADVPESTKSTIRRKDSVMNGGWFSRCGRERPSKSKSVFERAECDIVPMQSTISFQLQSSRDLPADSNVCSCSEDTVPSTSHKHNSCDF